MAFTHPSCLPAFHRRRARRAVCAQYLSPDAFNIEFDFPSKTGNFGGVFFGEYANISNGETAAVVVKCPVQSEIGRQLFQMEKYTNVKLQQKSKVRVRFPQYLGEVILPVGSNLTPGLIRMGLVWEQIGNGDTLEDYLRSSQVSQLASVLGTNSSGFPLRRELSAKVLYELALVLQDLQRCGIVHRDLKPENLLVVSKDPNGAPLKAIDFGSSCDWSSPFKKGLGLATCDPIYTAPERRLDIFKPAYRFDVYSIGLIALRCALPSLTDSAAMNSFVKNNLSQCGFCLQKTCSAILAGRTQGSQPLTIEIKALTGPAYEDMYALFATILTTSPEDRADVSDCIQSRFVRSELASRLGAGRLNGD